jgi:TetR/AcrR family transcriptional regulator, lmrAB and yxaGH operons repressor
VVKSYIEDDDLVLRILKVFREHGYEGTSIGMISQQTGLQRASLYYRFPGGKVEMAEAVMTSVDGWFDQHVFKPLRSEEDFLDRITGMCRGLAEFYGSGTKPCLLEALSLGHTSGPISDHLKSTYIAWRDVLTNCLLESGHTDDDALRLAEDAIASIQGALIIQRLDPDSNAFRRKLAQLPSNLSPRKVSI